jgi:transcriptional regulator with XRE-family HTH domain
MLSATLKTGLEQYRVGPKIRALRLKKKMGLVELGRHTGLSPALLSKLERGQMFPTLPTLLRVALVFSVGLDYFFAGSREKPVVAIVRKRERIRLPERPGARNASYQFESLDFQATERQFNSYLAEFFPAPADGLRPHAHPGVEFVYVLTGTLAIQLDAEEHVLEAGDSIYFDSSVPHSYHRRGTRACTGVVVTAP